MGKAGGARRVRVSLPDARLLAAHRAVQFRAVLRPAGGRRLLAPPGGRARPLGQVTGDRRERRG